MYDLWMLESNGSSTLDGSDMGTGSDYGALMQHLGIACIDFAFFSQDDGYEGM
jgi:hypothetical protein